MYFISHPIEKREKSFVLCKIIYTLKGLHLNNPFDTAPSRCVIIDKMQDAEDEAYMSLLT